MYPEHPPSPYGSSPNPSGNEFSPGMIRLFCILSYITPLWLVGLLVCPQNPRVRYHVNQGIVLTIFMVVLQVIVHILAFVLSGLIYLPLIGVAFSVTLILLKVIRSIVSFVFIIIGIVHAIQDRMVPLPFIGNLFSIFQ